MWGVGCDQHVPQARLTSAHSFPASFTGNSQADRRAWAWGCWVLCPAGCHPGGPSFPVWTRSHDEQEWPTRQDSSCSWNTMRARTTQSARRSELTTIHPSIHPSVYPFIHPSIQDHSLRRKGINICFFFSDCTMYLIFIIKTQFSWKHYAVSITIPIFTSKNTEAQRSY